MDQVTRIVIRVCPYVRGWISKTRIAGSTTPGKQERSAAHGQGTEICTTTVATSEVVSD